MKKPWLYPLFGVLIIAAGVAAYTGGRLLRETRDASFEGLRGTAFQIPPSVAEVTLTGVNGEIKLGDLKGNLTLVFFGFTKCPDICPLTLRRIAESYEAIGQPQNVKVVMISVDPERDTADIAQSYAAAFNPSFIGLSGTNTQVAEAVKTFYVAAQELPEGLFIHTDAVIIMDSQSRLRYVYSQDALLFLEQDLTTLLAQKDF
jgi:protein SCO1